MKRPRIAVVGSLNMDLVVSMPRMPQVGETVHGTDIHYIPGGKGANQAVGCARLGAEVSMIGAVGSDHFGREMLERLQEEGIDLGGVHTAEGPTGTAAIFHTAEDNCIAVVPGANAYCTPELVERHRERIESADVLLVQLEVPLDTVHRALEIARQAGVRTVLNPAPAKVLPAPLLSLADILTPNETEFALLSGEQDTSEEVLRRVMIAWQQDYGHTVILTRGRLGSSWLDEGERLRTEPALPVETVDTTGAGDAFNAALCFGLASGWDLQQAADFACRAASVSVTRFGAQAGMPRLEEVPER
ncbi:ribokinase [Paenibacillus mucilaginosus]|uniref:Ribokinase n=3 Tax=Paenibacillus mucilaginosus TaxID=61624 RepID=H6NC75_9BACL|nr:ribokinase [Paenibacillus mucilaginosus]AFC28268.1 ribokinase [Paenibacillus mucilaginosus 3016]WDM28905.1 ribokinase [Paenibacillus mucilaginosus]WFA17083.1 ribokinase [Paenibacillus mucilaginosus]